MDYKCFFNCTNDSPNLITCGVKRIETIKECSAKRGDGMFDLLTGVESIKYQSVVYLHILLKTI